MYTVYVVYRLHVYQCIPYYKLIPSTGCKHADVGAALCAAAAVPQGPMSLANPLSPPPLPSV